jgi:galactokinase
VLTENARVRRAVEHIDADDWSSLGAVLDASHASMRDDFEISCRELDLAVASARTAGALGARMTGGGFGGSAVALVPASRIQEVKRVVTRTFADAGLRDPAYLVATPGDAARVEALS